MKYSELGLVNTNQLFADALANNYAIPAFNIYNMETLTAVIDRYWLKAVLNDGNRAEPDGEITLFVGGHQPDEVSNRLTGTTCTELKIK